MKVEIQRLLDDWEETEIMLSSPADPARIQARIRAKLKPVKRKHHTVRKLMIAVAAAVLLVSSTFAVFYKMLISEVEPELVKAVDDSEVAGDENLYWVGPNHQLRYQVTGQGHIVGFRCSYLPETEGDVHMGSLQEDLMWSEAVLRQNGISLEMYERPDWNAAYAAYAVDKKVDGRIRNLFCIDLYQSDTLANADVVIKGEITEEKHWSCGELEAISFCLDESKAIGAIRDDEEEFSSPEEPPSNHVLLFDQANECLLHVYADTVTPLEELEQIAAGIVIVDTGIPVEAVNAWIPEKVWISNAKG